MSTKKYISIREFCRGHSLEEDFLFRLREFELIQIVEGRQGPSFPKEELDRIERLVRLYRDLDINPQGLQAIDHLLDRLETMQQEIHYLRRKLSRWE
jgi:hypothetical protein